jgi:hypothetical protein
MIALSSFSVIESSLKRLAPANGRRSEFFFTIRRDRRLRIVSPLYSRILVLMCKADAGSSHSR